jgi:hypothetical protein
MHGPSPRGTLSTKADYQRDFGHLILGKRYRVAKAFHDLDGDLHPVGEPWLYLGHNFFPYDDGLTLVVSLDGEQEWNLAMQWRAAQQGAILDVFEQYVVAAG